MMRKLLLTFVVFLVISTITVPVMAAPPATTANPLDQILTIVKDIQTNVGTILTKLTTLQTDVTTIKSTTDTINGKLDAPPEPIRYEYYSGRLVPFENSGESSCYIFLTNWGDTSADAHVYEYNVDWDGNHHVIKDYTYTLDANKETRLGNVVSHNWPRFVKISTNSKFVTPNLQFFSANGEGTGEQIVHDYLPGDFRKVEIYS